MHCRYQALASHQFIFTDFSFVFNNLFVLSSRAHVGYIIASSTLITIGRKHTTCIIDAILPGNLINENLFVTNVQLNRLMTQTAIHPTTPVIIHTRHSLLSARCPDQLILTFFDPMHCSHGIFPFFFFFFVIDSFFIGRML